MRSHFFLPSENLAPLPRAGLFFCAAINSGVPHKPCGGMCSRDDAPLARLLGQPKLLHLRAHLVHVPGKGSSRVLWQMVRHPSQVLTGKKFMRDGLADSSRDTSASRKEKFSKRLGSRYRSGVHRTGSNPTRKLPGCEAGGGKELGQIRSETQSALRSPAFQLMIPKAERRASSAGSFFSSATFIASRTMPLKSST